MNTPTKPCIRLMLVAESDDWHERLQHMLQSEPDIQVVSVVKNTRNVFDYVARFSPDLIAIDASLTGIDSATLVRQLMQQHPIPVIALAELKDDQQTQAMMSAGALSVAIFPPEKTSALFNQLAREFMQTIKIMAEVKVVRRRTLHHVLSQSPTPAPKPLDAAKLVVLGASTGGPLALKTILEGLEPGFSVPVVIVQHIAKGFTEGLVSWLNQHSGIVIRLARHGEFIQSGFAYIAPEDTHLLFGRADQLLLSNDAAAAGHRPSINRTFQSAAQYYGANALGVLLTGMGNDGAQGLLALRQKGGVTIVQDAASCAVNGMPAAAIALLAADYVQTPQQIAASINVWAQERNNVIKVSDHAR